MSQGVQGKEGGAVEKRRNGEDGEKDGDEYGEENRACRQILGASWELRASSVGVALEAVVPVGCGVLKSPMPTAIAATRKDKKCEVSAGATGLRSSRRPVGRELCRVEAEDIASTRQMREQQESEERGDEDELVQKSVAKPDADRRPTCPR